MPTAEEWSALFGATALIALGFAWHQIRQVDQSNKALIASNEHARQVNIEAVRPRVQVSLQMDRVVSKDRGAPVEGNIFIAVRNIGASPAHKVRLRVTPPFTSHEKFFKPGFKPVHFEEINRVFNGDVAFPTLSPGNNYIWFLGRAPDVFEEAPDVPRRWQVEADYYGTMSREGFRDGFVLDLDVEKRIEVRVDPLVRIGKDIQVVGDRLEGIRTNTSRSVSLSDRTQAALQAPRPAIRYRGTSARLSRGRKRHS